MNTSIATRVGFPRAHITRIIIAAGLVLAAWTSSTSGAWPETPVESLVSGSADESRHASVAMDGEGRFIVAYEKHTSEYVYDLWVDRLDVLVRRFAEDGDPIGVATHLNDTSVVSNLDQHITPSVAVSGDSQVYCVWLGARAAPSKAPDSVLTASFDFDTFSVTPIRPPTHGAACGGHDGPA